MYNRPAQECNQLVHRLRVTRTEIQTSPTLSVVAAAKKADAMSVT